MLVFYEGGCYQARGDHFAVWLQVADIDRHSASFSPDEFVDTEEQAMLLLEGE